MSRAIIAVVVGLSVACAAQKAQQPQPKVVARNDAAYSTPGQAKPKGVMRCQMEQETGSNRMERVCKYDEAAQSGDTAIDDAMIDLSRRATQTNRTGGPGQ